MGLIKKTLLVTILTLLTLISACTSDEQDSQKESKEQGGSTQSGQRDNTQKTQTQNKTKSTSSTSDPVVAHVNSTIVTRSQLNNAMERLLPTTINQTEKNKLSGKVLDSLIDSRLMALAEESKLDEVNQQQIAAKVDAYREELLVKRYIINNITPQPVSSEKIQTYYAENLQKFGGDVEKTFMVIQSKPVISTDEKNKLLSEFSKLSSRDDWSGWLVENKHLNLVYKESTSLVSLLKEPLKQLIVSTDEGKTSSVLNGKDLVIVRVTHARKIPAKPLSQVSRKIRRMLAPLALKDSLKEHLATLKKTATIKKITDKPDNTKTGTNNKSKEPARVKKRATD